MRDGIKTKNKKRRLKGGQHTDVDEEYKHRNVEKESGSGGRENNGWDSLLKQEVPHKAKEATTLM